MNKCFKVINRQNYQFYQYQRCHNNFKIIRDAYRELKKATSEGRYDIEEINKIEYNYKNESQDSIFDYDIVCLENKKKEMFKKYPKHKERIESIINLDIKYRDPLIDLEFDSSIIKTLYQRELYKKIEDRLYQDKAIKDVANITFEEQKSLQRKIVLEMDEETDYESEADDKIQQELREKQQQGQIKRDFSKMKRIYQHISVLNENVQIPDKKNKKALTIFFEIEDLLFHTYIYDENLGFFSDPRAKEPEYKLEIKKDDRMTPVNVYMRDYWQDFMKFLQNNKKIIEPILYTTGVSEYSNQLLDIIDPDREIFEHTLFQEACYKLELKEDNVIYLIKDITRFPNRPLTKSILIDTNPINFIMQPDNGFKVLKYDAEFVDEIKDETLLSLIEQIEYLSKLEDVRPFLIEQFSIRQLLKNSKLI